MKGLPLARLWPTIATLVCVAPAAGETLGDALRASGARVTAETVPEARVPITSYSVLRDRQAYVIAYYRDQGMGALVPPLFVGRLDRLTGRWTRAAIDEQAIRPAAAPLCSPRTWPCAMCSPAGPWPPLPTGASSTSTASPTSWPCIRSRSRSTTHDRARTGPSIRPGRRRPCDSSTCGKSRRSTRRTGALRGITRATPSASTSGSRGPSRSATRRAPWRSWWRSTIPCSPMTARSRP